MNDSESLSTPKQFAEQVSALFAEGEDSVPAMVELVLSTATALSVGDIHLEPTPNAMTVRFRRDGVLATFGNLPKEFSPNVIARCKVLAGLLSYRSDIPQEGGAIVSLGDQSLDVRISTFPTVYGERAAIRIFQFGSQQMKLDELGLNKRVGDVLKEELAKPEGLVLLSGPSGSGKTTTLYSALAYIRNLFSGGKSIVTVEDPVENKIEGITQTTINVPAGLTFAKSLSGILRQDPDVLMVGEIRDPETAHISVESALTGHLVLSTVHAARAGLVPHRLMDMGVEPYALAGTFRLAMAQRLVRLLCNTCKRQRDESDSEWLSVGCPDCMETGFKGRRLIAEYVKAGDALHEAIMKKDSRLRFLEIAEAEGQDLSKAAAQLVGDGLTTKLEIDRILAGGEK